MNANDPQRTWGKFFSEFFLWDYIGSGLKWGWKPLTLAVAIVLPLCGWYAWEVALGVVGSLASIVGIVFAAKEASQARTAAEAARDAARNATEQAIGAYSRFALEHVRRLLDSAETYVDAKDWKRASLRLSDLADQLSQLANRYKEPDADWLEACRAIHSIREPIAAGTGNRSFALTEDQRQLWTGWIVRIRGSVDRESPIFERRTRSE